MEGEELTPTGPKYAQEPRKENAGKYKGRLFLWGGVKDRFLSHRLFGVSKLLAVGGYCLGMDCGLGLISKGHTQSVL